MDRTAVAIKELNDWCRRMDLKEPMALVERRFQPSEISRVFSIPEGFIDMPDETLARIEVLLQGIQKTLAVGFNQLFEVLDRAQAEARRARAEVPSRGAKAAK